jgi:hypothetical protein
MSELSERPIRRSNYLDFGGAAGAAAVAAEETRDYLKGLGYGHGSLAQARAALDAGEGRNLEFLPLGSQVCDFCFGDLMGGEFDVLKDGRQRCSRCSRSVIKDQEQFIEEFNNVRRNMEMTFGISLAVPLRVRMVNAREIAKQTNETFTATDSFDPRVLGFARQKGTQYELYIENGSPRLPAIATMAHELTHIWQYKNWSEDQIVSRYGKDKRLVIYEGMANWVQIQYLLATRERSYAEWQFAYAVSRQDVYGFGFRVFLGEYGLELDGDARGDSPFRREMPLPGGSG